QFAGCPPGLLDPATLKIDGRTNPGGRQMLTIQPGSSDGFSTVRVRLYVTAAYTVRLRYGLVQDASLDPGRDGVVQDMQERWQKVNRTAGDEAGAALLQGRTTRYTD